MDLENTTYKVILFDIGCYKGEVLQRCINTIHKLKMDYAVYAFEADPYTYSKTKKRFINDKNIHLYNCAITSKRARIKLYRNVKRPKGGGQGNSIYKDKRNVGKKFVETDGKPISAILSKFNKSPTDIYIIKANIEGAEYDLICDMHKHDLFKQFDLFLGTNGGWTKDMNKVPSLQGRIKKAEKIIAEHDIKIYDSAKVDLKAKIKDIIATFNKTLGDLS